MRRKISEDTFDNVMDSLADTLGIKYHAELGHFHGDTIEETAEEVAQQTTSKVVSGALQKAMTGFTEQVNRLTEQAHGRFDKRLTVLERNQELIMKFLNITVRTDPERTYVTSTAPSVRRAPRRQPETEVNPAPEAPISGGGE